MGMLGRLIHYGFDAVLISTCLAGIRRSTGLTIKKKPSENESVNGFLDSYLWVGETVMDQSVAMISASGYFERRR